MDIIRDIALLDVAIPHHRFTNSWGPPSKPFYTHYGGYKIELSVLLRELPSLKLELRFTFLESEFAPKDKCKVCISAYLVDQKEGKDNIQLKHELVYNKHDEATHSYVFVVSASKTDTFKYINNKCFLLRKEKITATDCE